MSAAPSPLNASQRSALQAKLVARRLALRAEIETKLNTQDNPALLGMRNRMEETDDWAVADLESALDVAEVSRDAAELQEVEAALSRIKNNTYGMCLECGKPIPIARLDVSPMSARCVALPGTSRDGHAPHRSRHAVAERYFDAGRIGPAFAYFSIHAKNSPYQSREFCGFRIQWFSSGNQTRRVGTFFACSVL